MNPIEDLFSSSLVQSIGWTLLHSVWQTFFVFLIVMVLLRMIKTSSVRYATILAALSITCLLSILTFAYLEHTSNRAGEHQATPTAFYGTTNLEEKIPSAETALTDLVQANMNIIVVCWIIGAILFSLRAIGGGIYVSMLRKNSSAILNHWNERTQELARQLIIKRIITLAESARVNTPLVLGYLKPVIILPAGMLSGLSSEQIEMIIMHELMHIRRHDYLVNIIQMILESIFFFNPFVWILSGELRKEREHCCDDAVVRQHPNALAYVSALAQLEEVRMNNINPALGFAQNKNRLLNRIKRLMENSVKNYSAQSRIIPAVLLVTGLICASWLTISKGIDEPENNVVNNATLSLQDTSIHTKDKNTGYSRTEITTIDANGEPHTEIIENYDVDAFDDLVFNHDFEIPEPPAIADFEMIPPFPDFIYEYDTVPGTDFGWHHGDVEKFSEEFQKKFREEFGDFYKKNQKDFNRMMKELEQNLEKEMNTKGYARMNADMVQQAAHLQQQLHHEMMVSNLEEHARAMAEHNEAMEKMNEDLNRWEKDHAEQLKALDKNMKRMEENMKKFETELQRELIKDGYLKAGDKINNIHWDTKGDIEVNGEKIKNEHLDKYNKLHDKFFTDKDLIQE
ncbi:MAG TPA: M56 family metallopeptidase [Ohtaekwangia sp.]